MKTEWTTSGLIGALKTAGSGKAVEVVSPLMETTETCGLVDISSVVVCIEGGGRRQKVQKDSKAGTLNTNNWEET